MKLSKKSKIKEYKIKNDHKSKNKSKKTQKNTDNWTLERKLISNELTKVKDIKYCYLSHLEDDLYLSIVKHNQNIRSKSFVMSLKKTLKILGRNNYVKQFEKEMGNMRKQTLLAEEKKVCKIKTPKKNKKKKMKKKKTKQKISKSKKEFIDDGVKFHKKHIKDSKQIKKTQELPAQIESHKKDIKDTKQIKKTKELLAQIEKTKQAMVIMRALNFHHIKDIEQIEKIKEQVVNALDFCKKQIGGKTANAKHTQIKKTKQSSDELSSFLIDSCGFVQS